MIIMQIEKVSSFFGYKEEYVLDHSPWWIRRKFEQAIKEEYQESQGRTLEGLKSMLLLADQALNDGKAFESIMPSFEKAMEMQNNQDADIQNDKFVSGQWWKTSAENSN